MRERSQLKTLWLQPGALPEIHVINNGNWTEWSAIWSEIIRVILNWTGAQREFHLRPQIWIQTKIARHEVQLPHYYGHFEIAESCQYQYLFDLVAGLSKSRSKRLLHLILYPKQKWCNIEPKWCDLKQKWCNLGHEWHDFEQTWFRAKNSAIRE